MSGDPSGGGSRGQGGSPYEMPERRRLHAAVLAVAVLAVLTVIGGIVAVTIAPLFISRVGPVTGWGAWWCGEGAFVVGQLRDGNGVPGALAWDRRSGEAIVQEGFRVVAIEPHAPRVWLVPDEGDGPLMGPEADEPPSDLAGDSTDSPPERLLLWDLASGEPPTDDAASRWAPWSGDGGWSAFAEIDVLKGSLPSKLLFQPAGGRTEGTQAAIPGDVSTFEPLGWSAEGKFFAIFALGGKRPRAILFDPVTGSAVASAAADPEPRGGFGAPAAWSPAANELVWLSGGRRQALTPRGFAGTADADGKPARTLAVVPSGVLAYLPDKPDVYTVGEAVKGAPRVGAVGDVAGIAFFPSPGLAFLQGEPPQLKIGPVEGEFQVVWQAPR